MFVWIAFFLEGIMLLGAFRIFAHLIILLISNNTQISHQNSLPACQLLPSLCVSLSLARFIQIGSELRDSFATSSDVERFYAQSS